MSDLYDSLEDERDENKCSSDSLDLYKTATANSDKGISDSELTDNYSFYLSKNENKEGVNSLPNIHFSKTQPISGEKKNFLPVIGNVAGEKNLESIRSFIVDSQILSQQGLQLNNDGSFTKSPRLEEEELPFITREYRNLQFQKKKLYKTERRSTFTKIQKKNMFSFSEKSADGISMNQIIKARRKKGSSEELLTSRGSSYSSHSKTEKQVESNGNLTDSMKERLLSQKGSPRKSIKPARNIKKTKREFHILQNCEDSKLNKFSNRNSRDVDVDPKKSFLSHERLQKNLTPLNGHPKKPKSTDSKIFKHQSDILLNSARPKLNYSEQRLLKIGCNPLHLRHWNKKILSDTSRSNFGDSAVEELSEVSSLALDIKSLKDEEDEELFYQKLIEKDKNMKLHNQLSTRSECHAEAGKLSQVAELNSCKDQQETRRIEKNYHRGKHISKLMSIDLPPEFKCSAHSLKKFNHYCSVDASPKVSKIELALKAKTYGYLANARNIFRLKAQSERKCNTCETENQNTEIISEKKIADLSQDAGLLTKQNLLLQNRFPKIKGESPETENKVPKATRSLSRTKQLKISGENQEGIILPQVNSPQTKNNPNRKEIMQQMSSYLKTPNG